MARPKSKTASAQALVGLWAIALTAFVIVALYFARGLLIPFALSALLTFLISPLVGRLERWLGRIVPSANGHMQATGRDARRRKQYRYHERWRAARDENKYDRMVLFGEALPKIRKRVEADVALPGLQRNKVLATVVQLLQRTLIRVGNEQYARDNNSFGLTTMKDRHVHVTGSKLRFRFQGKSGIKHDVDVQDRRIAKIVAKVQDLPGQKLFQYLSDDGEGRDVTSQDVNDYLLEITGEDFTAKDISDLGRNRFGRHCAKCRGSVRNKPKQTSKMQSARSPKYSGILLQFVESVTLILLCSKVILKEMSSKV